jgi:UDP-GlcNAc3NAcA epimerase
MSDVFFDDLSLDPPLVNLAIHSLPRDEMIAQMASALAAPIASLQPAMIIVYGDTNSTLAGALAAREAGLPVTHVEAGLRSFNLAMPEELNRIAVDRISDLLFCPTAAAVQHLRDEGITEGVLHVGDVMYDQTLQILPKARAESTILARLGLATGGYAVATLHRAGNTDDGTMLQSMLDWLRAEAQKQPVIFPVHPRTRKVLEAADMNTRGLTLIDPVGFLDMVCLVHQAAAVFTDSGGLQKEAYFHRVPCVTLRDETEWIETIQAGWNRLWSQPDYLPRRDIPDYGDGRAGAAIAAAIGTYLAERGAAGRN